MRTLPPGSENDCALTSRLEITCPSRESWPGTENVSAAAALEAGFDRDVVAELGFVGDRRQRR